MEFLIVASAIETRARGFRGHNNGRITDAAVAALNPDPNYD